jgi:kynurenine aminotransferase
MEFPYDLDGVTYGSVRGSIKFVTLFRYVPLRPNPKPGQPLTSGDFKLNIKELEAAITPKTKVLIINTPQNVPGKVYTRQELEEIAAVVKKHNLLIIMDEVYEGMVYDNNELVRMATLPGMWERTLTIGKKLT